MTIKLQLATEQMQWKATQENEQLRYDREHNVLRTGDPP